MLGKLVRFILQKIQDRKDIPRGYTYVMSEHRGWGNSIVWTNWPELRVHGWLSRIPEVGDVLVADFKSGTKCEFQVTSVRTVGDPADMFFADVKFLKYLVEPKVDLLPS